MDFLGIGAAEFLVIGLVAFLILGPTRMNEMARNIGKLIREIRQTTNDIPALLSPEAPLEPDLASWFPSPSLGPERPSSSCLSLPLPYPSPPLEPVSSK